MAERVGVRERRADDALEPVERGDGRDGDEQTDRRGDERLGDVGHDGLGSDLRRRRRQRRVLLLTELVERADDADDGAEQPDERRVVAERAEEREALLELQLLESARAEHRLFGGLAAHARLDDAGDDDRRLGARRGLEALARAVEIAAAEEASEIAHERRARRRGATSRATPARA